MKKQHEFTAAAPAIDAFADDQLVTQRQLQRIAGGISAMSVWRWRRAGIIPEPTNIRGRNYWRARDVRAALGRLMQGGVTA